MTIRRTVAVAAREVTAAEFRAFLAATRLPARRRVALPGRRHGRLRAIAPGHAASRSPTHAPTPRGRARACPTSSNGSSRPEQPGFERLAPAVWNWTESEHSDGITRFVMLKGGSEHVSVGSDWYTDGGVRDPSFSLKLLLAGLGVERSSSIGFRLAWDVEDAR